MNDSIDPAIIAMILAELTAARRKHPHFPNDVVYGAAIVAEEAGELIRAANDYRLLDAGSEAMLREAAQTAVTAIRFLEMMIGATPEAEGGRHE